MSRLAKKPVKIPEDVTITMNGNLLIFKGPKGETKVLLPVGINIEKKDKELFVSFKEGDKKSKDRNKSHRNK